MSMQEVFSVGIEKMSKSKKNVVAPTEIFEKYGADSARMFILSDTPYEKEFEWTDAGVKSVHKYLQRVWALACTATERAGVENQEMIKQMHRFLSAYICCFERFEFNVAIAKLREFTNFLSGLDYADKSNNYTLGLAMRNVAIVFSPICPHLCEAMWQMLGGEGLCCQQKLPAVDAKYLEETTMQVSIAVNGKFKVCITLDKNLEQDAIIEESKKQPKVANALAGKEIKKTIVANSKLGKMVNFVVL